jgi:hypothetical protein
MKTLSFKVFLATLLMSVFFIVFNSVAFAGGGGQGVAFLQGKTLAADTTGADAVSDVSGSSTSLVGEDDVMTTKAMDAEKGEVEEGEDELMEEESGEESEDENEDEGEEEGESEEEVGELAQVGGASEGESLEASAEADVEEGFVEELAEKAADGKTWLYIVGAVVLLWAGKKAFKKKK